MVDLSRRDACVSLSGITMGRQARLQMEDEDADLSSDDANEYHESDDDNDDDMDDDESSVSSARTGCASDQDGSGRERRALQSDARRASQEKELKVKMSQRTQEIEDLLVAEHFDKDKAIAAAKMLMRSTPGAALARARPRSSLR